MTPCVQNFAYFVETSINKYFSDVNLESGTGRGSPFAPNGGFGRKSKNNTCEFIGFRICGIKA